MKYNRPYWCSRHNSSGIAVRIFGFESQTTRLIYFCHTILEYYLSICVTTVWHNFKKYKIFYDSQKSNFFLKSQTFDSFHSFIVEWTPSLLKLKHGQLIRFLINVKLYQRSNLLCKLFFFRLMLLLLMKLLALFKKNLECINSFLNS